MNLKKHLVSFKMCLLICAFLNVSQFINAQTTVVGWDGAAFSYQGFDNTAQIGTNPYANTGITANSGFSSKTLLSGLLKIVQEPFLAII